MKRGPGWAGALSPPLRLLEVAHKKQLLGKSSNAGQLNQKLYFGEEKLKQAEQKSKFLINSKLITLLKLRMTHRTYLAAFKKVGKVTNCIYIGKFPTW